MASANKVFVQGIPKVELHMHIEGVLDAPLRLKLARRNGLKDIFDSLEELQYKYRNFFENALDKDCKEDPSAAFFDLLYGGYKVLVTEEDFYECAMLYYEKAALMNVRYAELFIEFQALMLCGVSVDTQMAGYRRAQLEAAERLGVKSAWILNFARREDPKDAVKAYELALKHRDIIIGFGMAGWSDGTSPLQFNEVYTRARADGFKLTIHCDPHIANIHNHIYESATQLGGGGVDRIDHGINTADKQELIQLVRSKNLGLTICPWITQPGLMDRPDPEAALYDGIIRKLYDNGVKISIGSDDPALVLDRYLTENMEAVAEKGRFTEGEIRQLCLNAVDTSWASDELKAELRAEVLAYNPKH